jgi:effector-binding domain-containing protein
MKNLKIAALLIILAFVGYFYIYIPNAIKVSSFKISNAFELTATRLLADPKLLPKSMGANYDSNNHKITVNGIEFTIQPALSNLVEIDIASKHIKTKSFITANGVTKQTTAINWFFEFKTTLNPIQRFSDYQEAIEIKNATNDILNHMSAFLEAPKYIYGYDIKEVTLQDTILITTKFVSKGLPTNAQIYAQADGLIKYLTDFKKVAINNPMVTVLENPNNDYTIMVGISINGEIPQTEKYRIKRMPVNGKMFVTDATGGYQSIQNGYAALKSFLLDSKRPSPAVPFELLLNDRRLIADSTEWQTRIYYPVM